MSKLSNSITVTLAGEQKNILMSFAKLNRCNFLLGDIDNLANVMMAPSMREAIVKEMISDRGAPIDIHDIDLSNDDVIRLLDFVSEHLLDFTLRALDKATALSDKNADKLKALEAKASPLTVIKNGPTA